MATTAVGGTPLDNLSMINVSALVTQTIAAERTSQDSLKGTLSGQQAELAAYKKMNTTFTSLQTAAVAIVGSVYATSPTWATSGITSSNTTVAATASATAGSGEYRFNVTQLAKSHSLLYGNGVDTSTTVASGQFIIRNASGMPVLTLNPKPPATTSSDLTLPEVVAAINGDSSSSVRAAMIGVGDGLYRLQLTSKSTGASSEFSVDGLDDLGSTTVAQQGQDAKIQFGSNATTDVASSSSNTFSDVFPDVTFTVSATTVTDPAHTPFAPAVTLTVGDDVTSMETQIQGLVDALNASTTAITSATHSSASGPGALSGDTWLRSVPQSLARIFVNNSGVSSDGLGLSIDKYGVMSFDAATFRAQLASDSSTTKATITELARQVGAITKVATQPVAGMVVKALADKQNSIDALDKRIAAWDDKLAIRTTMLTQLYSTLNANLASMKTTSDWISSQITSLTAKTN